MNAFTVTGLTADGHSGINTAPPLSAAGAPAKWLLDNELTPHLVVDVNTPVNVPMEYAQDGQIVLNIAPRAVGNLEMTNEWVGF